MKTYLHIIIVLSLFTLSSCQKAYFNALEKAGYHKRDILVSRVENVQEAQIEAKEEFASALEKFSSVVSFSGGDLEEKYNSLNDAYESSEAKANNVKKRIDSVESVANALFSEWRSEIEDYKNLELQRASKSQLRATESKYEELLTAMRKAESRIDPVLTAFNDYVMSLKHNLNARAIAALQGELVAVEQDVSDLIREMELSIDEADQFIRTMNQS